MSHDLFHIDIGNSVQVIRRFGLVERAECIACVDKIEEGIIYLDNGRKFSQRNGSELSSILYDEHQTRRIRVYMRADPDPKFLKGKIIEQMQFLNLKIMEKKSDGRVEFNLEEVESMMDQLELVRQNLTK